MSQAVGLDRPVRTARKVYPPMATGQKFGMLTAVKEVGRDRHHNKVWLFACDCGRSVEKAGYVAKQGLQRSCGCLKNKHAYRVVKPGDRFGHLAAVQPLDTAGKRGDRWVFVCDCGQEITRRPWHITAGRAKSCGCLSLKAGQTHGGSKSPAYQSWIAMRRRCSDPNNIGYKNYGGRGVLVCERWNESFEAFLTDMGPRPPGTSLDRWPDKNGNYMPSNCRWASAKDQGRNTRQTRVVRFRGRDLCLKDAAQMAGLPYQVVQGRLRRGWPIETALTKPAKPRPPRVSAVLD